MCLNQLHSLEEEEEILNIAIVLQRRGKAIIVKEIAEIAGASINFTLDVFIKHNIIYTQIEEMEKNINTSNIPEQMTKPEIKKVSYNKEIQIKEAQIQRLSVLLFMFTKNPQNGILKIELLHRYLTYKWSEKQLLNDLKFLKKRKTIISTDNQWFSHSPFIDLYQR